MKPAIAMPNNTMVKKSCITIFILPASFDEVYRAQNAAYRSRYSYRLSSANLSSQRFDPLAG
ncbi:MAG: hypothetical protein LBU17_02140 [Treponema sp.]|jgi:hypothetical protein|nr:hypothetical protein [Treponema sp.]